jgi:hypothetical protein
MHEKMNPGIYEDETTGDIWRKSPQGSWTVNGQPWKPFPKVLTTLHKVISTPAVSIMDAVRTEPTIDDWRIIPGFTLYEVNPVGDIRTRESLERGAPLHPFITRDKNGRYLMFDDRGEEHWLTRNEAYMLTFRAGLWTSR